MLVVPHVVVHDGDSIFGDGSPYEVARTLVASGARAIALRDVEGELATSPAVPTWVGPFVQGVGVPVHLDASLVDAAGIERMSRLGFASVTVGMGAVFDTMTLRWALDLLGPARLVVELASDGDHLYDPPANQFDMELVAAAKRLQQLGVHRVLVRDVTGVELPLMRLQQLCRAVTMQVRYSGIVRSLGDVEELTVVGPQLEMIFVGEPVYDGRLDLAKANQIAGRAAQGE